MRGGRDGPEPRFLLEHPGFQRIFTALAVIGVIAAIGIPNLVGHT